jgi:hypothetical protein
MSRHERRPGAPERVTAIALAAGRAAIGTAFWLTPDLAAKTLGFKQIDDGSKAVARIAGTRDLVLAAWAFGTLDDRERLRRASIAVAAADAADAVAFALLLRSGEANRMAAVRGLAAAVPATALGLWLIDALR